MSILTIGKVRPTYKGEWDSTVSYEVLDWVLYRGFAWQALQDVPANREPDVTPAYWVQTGMKGDRGDKGDTGLQGPAGVDGRNGLDGIQGPQGLGPKHKWTGSTLSFENPDGTWAAAVNLLGPQGVIGPEGPVGAQGLAGPAGAQGPAGPQGLQGAQGVPGTTPSLVNINTSTSTTQAPTANAVKLTRDEAWGWANTAQVTATAAQGTANAAQGTANAAQGTANTAVQKADAAQNTANTALGAVPRGIICLWSGAANAVPVGWALCNGGNTTPDLRDRFVVAAGGKYAVGAKGGAETQNVSASLNGAVGATTLSAGQMPSHNHSRLGKNPNSDGYSYSGSTDFIEASSSYSGGSGSHTHSLSGSASDTVSVLPPYYALAYIIKL